jgi:PepB aminopeptidase
VVPEGKGRVAVLVSKDASFPYMRAARALCRAGLVRFKLQPLQNADMNDLYSFLHALGGAPEYEVALPLDEVRLERLSSLIGIVEKARELCDTGSRNADPESVVQTCAHWVEKAASKFGGSVSVSIARKGDPEFARYAGLSAVGSGSLACMGIIDCMPEGCSASSPFTAVVGKGITFDSGGYNLKPGKYMEDMRTDKTGAVTAAAAVAFALATGLSTRVRAYLPCARNLVGPDSMVPGDIISYPDGTRVEITDTDAEGRLVLADGLIKACEDGARTIVDAATLTGSAKAAVGRDMCCVFTRDNRPDPDLAAAFDESREQFWQMPLCDYHSRFLKSRRADMQNAGQGVSAPGASVAAAFLGHFVKKDIGWIHVDLSSAYLPEGSPFLAPGPTGALIAPLGLWLSGGKIGV